MLKRLMFIFMTLILAVLNCSLVEAADVNSILSLISAPIAGFSLPSNLIAQANAYLLSHPDINYEALEAQIINARGVVQAAIQGKEINSISDIAKCVTDEQKNAVIANLQKVANSAQVSVAVEQNDKGEESIVLVDKTTGTKVFNKESIIKETGRNPEISSTVLRNSLILVLFLIEFSFISMNRRYKYIN